VESAFAQDLIPIRIVGMNYPPLAVLARITGTLRIKCNVSPDGKVRSAEILDSSDKPISDLLSMPSQENALQWIFPSSLNQSERSFVLKYSFDLTGKHDPSKASRFVFDSPGSVRVTAEFSDLLIVD
jgi:hypothetical protein